MQLAKNGFIKKLPNQRKQPFLFVNVCNNCGVCLLTIQRKLNGIKGMKCLQDRSKETHYISIVKLHVNFNITFNVI
jgi:hypothetical protein